MKAFSIVCITSFGFILSCSAQWGIVDSSFGVNGVATTAGGARDCIVQSDDKILVTGWGQFEQTFSLTRFKADGSKDSTFGTNGTAYEFVGSSSAASWNIELQPDGKIIESGYTRNDVGSWCFALVRHTADGELDNSFSGDGKVLTSFSANSDALGLGVAIQPDGKIIQVGDKYENNTHVFAAVRYNSNGSIDNSFGVNGKVITPIGNLQASGSSVAIQPNGMILLSGYAGPNSGAPESFVLVRYDAFGNLDPSFGSNGIVTTFFGGGGSSGADYESSIPFDIALQADGKIVLVGTAALGNNSWTQLAVARYNTNGSLDNSFANTGKILILNENFGYGGNGVFIQPDNKIVICGQGGPTNSSFILLRFNNDGLPDPTFGVAGMVNTNIDNTYSGAYEMDIQSNGKLVAAGFSQNGCKVVRYNSGVEVGINPIGTNNIPAELFPNPVHFNATIKYDLPQNDHLTMVLKDMLGNTSQTFMAGENKSAGLHIENLELNHSLSAGTYFLEIDGMNTFKILKLIVQ